MSNDILHMAQTFDTLQREYEEIVRDLDEEVVAHQVAIKKLEEEKKARASAILADIAALEKGIRTAVLDTQEGVEAGRYKFGYSVRRSADAKAMERDLIQHPLLGAYLKETPIVTMRRS